METVLTAIIVFFVILFGIFMLSGALITSQGTLSIARLEMETRLYTQARTHTSLSEGSSSNNGTTVKLILKNDGDMHLIDFEHWDVIIQYLDQTVVPGYRVEWLSYTRSNLDAGEWTVSGIYADAAQNEAEIYEPTVFNPGEELVIVIKPTLGIAAGTPVRVGVSTSNGSNLSAAFTSNYLPELVYNNGMSMTANSSRIILNADLLVEDQDDEPQDLVYTIEAVPAQGLLNLGASFTQQDIDSGLLSYSHTGSGDDQFAFSVSDGKDSTGVYVFTIHTSELPVLAQNNDLIVSLNNVYTISAGLLSTSDPDNTPVELVYTITYPPMQGSLNLGASFTQQDIDSGLLNYTYTGSGSDSFQFTVSDDLNTIGAYIFYIVQA